jgi:hypothetical protein
MEVPATGGWRVGVAARVTRGLIASCWLALFKRQPFHLLLSLSLSSPAAAAAPLDRLRRPRYMALSPELGPKHTATMCKEVRGTRACVCVQGSAYTRARARAGLAAARAELLGRAGVAGWRQSTPQPRVVVVALPPPCKCDSHRPFSTACVSGYGSGTCASIVMFVQVRNKTYAAAKPKNLADDVWIEMINDTIIKASRRVAKKQREANPRLARVLEWQHCGGVVRLAARVCAHKAARVCAGGGAGRRRERRGRRRR